MAIQMLGKVGYSPARDVYHILPNTMQTVAEHMLINHPFKPLHKWLEGEGFSLDDFQAGLNSYIKFMTVAKSTTEVTKTQALDESGWRQVPWQVQTAVMFYSGMVMTGIFFEGARMNEAGEESHVKAMNSLIASGRDLADYVTMPAWRRWLFRWRYHRRPIHFKG